MRRSPPRLAFILLVLCALTPLARPAAAGGFGQAWSLSGWDFRQHLGRCTSGPGPDLLFSSKADGHFAIFDRRTGALVQDFAILQGYTFCDSTTTCSVVDLNDDGVNELGFNQEAVVSPQNPLLWVLHWNGTQLTATFHPLGAEVTSGYLTHLRSATSVEMALFMPGDVLIIDPNLSGSNQIWKASTAIPGWAGGSDPLPASSTSTATASTIC